MDVIVFAESRAQVVADLWEPYINLLTEKVPDGDALDKVGCKRYCCRRMIMTHVDLIEKLLKYVLQILVCLRHGFAIRVERWRDLLEESKNGSDLKWHNTS